MQWYYANNGQRQGPVGETEFARLTTDGSIRADTLVWRHGMPDWKPYAEVAATLPPPVAQPIEFDDLDATVAALRLDPPPLRYAGIWPRVAAKLIDWIILFFAGRVLASAMGLGGIDIMPLAEGDMEQLMPLLQQLSLLFLADSAMRLGFYWFFLKKYAATPGKLAFGLKIVRADGSRLTDGRIVARFFAEIVSKYFTMCIGYIVAAFDDEKRALHDHLCDTRVVKSR